MTYSNGDGGMSTIRREYHDGARPTLINRPPIPTSVA